MTLFNSYQIYKLNLINYWDKLVSQEYKLIEPNIKIFFNYLIVKELEFNQIHPGLYPKLIMHNIDFITIYDYI